MGAGKRAGARRAAKRAPSFRSPLLGPAAGVTLAVVAWGYLVHAAIDFGATARSGDSRAWIFLALASLGAVACLFVGLLLVSRVLQHLGLTGEPTQPRRSTPSTGGSPVTPPPPRSSPSSARPAGGRRAAR